MSETKSKKRISREDACRVYPALTNRLAGPEGNKLFAGTNKISITFFDVCHIVLAMQSANNPLPQNVPTYADVAENVLSSLGLRISGATIKRALDFLFPERMKNTGLEARTIYVNLTHYLAKHLLISPVRNLAAAKDSSSAVFDVSQVLSCSIIPAIRAILEREMVMLEGGVTDGLNPSRTIINLATAILVILERADKELQFTEVHQIIFDKTGHSPSSHTISKAREFVNTITDTQFLDSALLIKCVALIKNHIALLCFSDITFKKHSEERFYQLIDLLLIPLIKEHVVTTFYVDPR